ncbi:MAG: pilus assembly protein TadC [Rhodobacteraceae bacterium]|nr:MAG: pilus assembly protein TadC [Paracoccaceae bacterium]
MIPAFMDILTSTFGPFGPILAFGAFGALLITLTLPFILVKKKDPFDRINQRQIKTSDTVKAKNSDVSLRHKQTGPNLEKFASFLEPQDLEEFSKRKMILLQAGYRGKDAVRNFHFFQFLLGILGVIIGGAYTLFLSTETDMVMQLLKGGAPAFIGYYLPIYWVNRRKAAREAELESGFPDSLDLMLVCIEAGQSLDQTIQRVGTELKHSYPHLSDEYLIVANEMRAGKEKSTVLKDFSERTGVPDIKSFVTVLVQSATFGTSIGASLRVYSAEMRDKRIMRVEEKANKLPTKMTLCTMMFTVPPLMVLLVGPSVYQIMQVF